MKILVISRGVDFVASIKRCLASEESLDITTADDVPQGTGAAKPDVIFLESIKPDVDGPGICKKIRSNKQYRDSSIIAVIGDSGSSGETISELVASGVSDVIRYPLHPAECCARVRAVRQLQLFRKKCKKQSLKYRMAQAHLDECSLRLSTISNTVPAGIVIIDPETHVILDANIEALRMFQAHGAAVVGRVCHRYICPADKGKCPVTDLGSTIDQSERFLLTTGGEQIPILKTVVPAAIGGKKYLFEMFTDISAQKQADAIRENLIARLQKALQEVKTLRGLLPICASCKKIRDDQGLWNQIENYIEEHSEAQFSHGLCPECVQKLYPELCKEDYETEKGYAF